MPLAKKAPVVMAPVGAYQKELQYLYERRMAIDTLIESLQTYERYRAKSIAGEKRKSA